MGTGYGCTVAASDGDRSSGGDGSSNVIAVAEIAENEYAVPKRLSKQPQ